MIWLISFAFASDLTITVVDAKSGAPISNATARCLPQHPNDIVGGRSDANGELNISCEPGDREVEVFHDSYGRMRLPYKVKRGDDLELRFRLSRPAELIVVSEKKGSEITKHVVTAEELKMVPGTFGDPVRALQALPGVARPNIAEGAIVVRGAEGLNTGFYVDGMPVPYMFHTLIGRSVIIPAFIDDVVFFPGGMPSKYGEVTQSVVNIRTDTEPVQGTMISARVDFLDGGLAVEHKLTDDITVRTAGRYSWVAGLISAGSSIATRRAGGDPEEAAYLAPKYWDAFSDVRWQISPEDELSLMYLASRDTLFFSEGRVDEDGDGKADPLEWEDQELSYNPTHWIDNQFWRVRARWLHQSDKREHETWASFGTEQQQNLLGAWWLSRQGPYRGRVGGPSLVVRHDDSLRLGPQTSESRLVFGGQSITRWFTAEDFQETFNVQDYSELEEVKTEDTQQIASLWIEPQIQWKKLYLGMGIRGAYYYWDKQSTIQPEPRLTARYELPAQWLLKAAVGRYTQAPPLERYAQGIGNPDLNIMTAWQGSFGTEGELGYGVSLDSSVFVGAMDSLVVRDLEVDTYNNGDLVTTELQPYYLGVKGLAYGLETLVRVRPSQRPWWGWVSLTLSKANRIDDSGNSFPSDYDQPIAVTVVGAYDLPSKWELSGRVQYTTGQPYTPLYGVYIPNAQSFAAVRGDLNSDRYPDYFRVDLRIQKKVNRPKIELTYYTDVYNATRRSNPFIAIYRYDYSELYDLAGIPIIVTSGVEAKF